MPFQSNKKGGGSKKAGVNKPGKGDRKAQQQARPKHPGQERKQGSNKKGKK